VKSYWAGRKAFAKNLSRGNAALNLQWDFSSARDISAVANAYTSRAIRDSYFLGRTCILSPSISIRRGAHMSGQSENMMDLLKELAVLKELDGRSEAELHSEESSARRTRRQQITDQIRALGETAS
jgi:hypothetical protein